MFEENNIKITFKENIYLNNMLFVYIQNQIK